MKSGGTVWNGLDSMSNGIGIARMGFVQRWN